MSLKIFPLVYLVHLTRKKKKATEKDTTVKATTMKATTVTEKATTVANVLSS